MRVLVTGAYGYLGLAVLMKLAGKLSLVGLGRPARVPAAPPVPTIAGDARGIAKVIADHGPFDAVIHLAGGGGPAKVEADPVRAVADNISTTIAVASAAKDLRLLFASTIAVYGGGGGVFREADGPSPTDLYGALKAAAEEIVALHGGTSLRLANVYGVGSGIDVGLDGAAERFARAAAAGRDITVYGEGTQAIDYVHVDDVVDAFAAALAAPALPAVLNVGSGRPTTIAALARTAADAGRAMGASPHIVSVAPPPGKVWPDRSLDISLAERVLGWRPRVPVDEGMRALTVMMKSTMRST
ncbi:MAG TPA: NAD(P)-dependent oxidoreductase [Haliangiales bacterium]|nr:NAD(P)-dependent oxidoreductase [Haliangiales bacterium]